MFFPTKGTISTPKHCYNVSETGTLFIKTGWSHILLLRLHEDPIIKMSFYFINTRSKTHFSLQYGQCSHKWRWNKIHFLHIDMYLLVLNSLECLYIYDRNNSGPNLEPWDTPQNNFQIRFQPFQWHTWNYTKIIICIL